MDILVIGSGGREHAIVKKLKESKKVGKIYCAPGNGGISRIAECVDMAPTDIECVVKFSKENNIGLVVVTPDDPLAAGMVDALEAAGIRAFGPNKDGAEVESSKVFAKNLMKRYAIPTPRFNVFNFMSEALFYIKAKNTYPIVIKADGLALGKGVVVAKSFDEAQEALQKIMVDRIFGDSGKSVVIEEFVKGNEISVLTFTDGKTVVAMPASMDHKQVNDNDEGPNTGGMGVITPNEYYTPQLHEYCMKNIYLPTIKALKREGRIFKGCLYFGLMLNHDGVYVIEYNSRFGDPETQAILPLLKTDLVDIFNAVIDEKLEDIDIEWEFNACACVVLASEGYPGKYKKGLPISGLDNNGNLEGVDIFHAGTVFDGGSFKTNGGRVLGVTAKGGNIDEALANAYRAVNKVSFDGVHYRTDIGRRNRHAYK